MELNVLHIDFKRHFQVRGDDRVLLRDIWKELNVQKHFTDWAKHNLSGFTENEDFGSFPQKVKREIGASMAKEYWVTVDTAKHIAMLSRSDEGKKVRQYFIECERLVFENNLEHQLSVIPRVLNADFFSQLANNMRCLEVERDYFKRTKAEISDKKTATAMATASTAVRQKKQALQLVENLKIRLGEAQDWATAMVAKTQHAQLRNFNEVALGKMLSKKSRQMNVEVRKKPAPEYPNGIGIYHISVIKAVLKDI